MKSATEFKDQGRNVSLLIETGPNTVDVTIIHDDDTAQMMQFSRLAARHLKVLLGGIDL